MTIEEKVLSIFLKQSGKHMLAKEISSLISESESEIRHTIEYWKQKGFEFALHPQLGYSLAESPDKLYPEEFAARLPENPFAKNIHVLPHVDSTNTYAMGIAPVSPDGTSVIAECQASGRGRHGRSWHSAEGCGIYLSCIFKPDWPFENTSRLVTIVSVAACRALEKIAPIRISLKWPNDLLLKNSKIGGILTEARIQGSKLAFAIAGIGINVNHSPEDFPEDIRERSTSLAVVAGHKFRRADVLTHLLHEIHSAYQCPFHVALAEWKERCVSIGKPIQVHEHTHIYSGIMAGLDEEGALLLRLEDGRIRTIRSGEILFY